MPIGAVASAFVALMVPILSFPSVTGSALDSTTMNWTCVVYGGPMFLVLVWWIVSARKWFKGPKVNLGHLMHGREVIEGKEVGGEASSGDEGTVELAKDGGEVKVGGR